MMNMKKMREEKKREREKTGGGIRIGKDISQKVL
jgi:hypothetical protein